MPEQNPSTPGDDNPEQKNDVESVDSSDEGKDEGGKPDAKKEEGKADKPDEVTIPKSEYNALQAFKRKSSKKKSGTSRSETRSSSGGRFSFETPPEPTQEEVEIEQEREYARLQRSVLSTVLRNKQYQKVLENDKTLAKVVENNPLALLESDPVDADDALEQITSLFDERVEDLKGKDDKKKADKKEKEEPADQPKPEPPVKVAPEKAGNTPEPHKTLDDISSGLMKKVKVGGKSV